MILAVPNIKLDFWEFQNINWKDKSFGHKPAVESHKVYFMPVI